MISVLRILGIVMIGLAVIEMDLRFRTQALLVGGLIIYVHAVAAFHVMEAIS